MIASILPTLVRARRRSPDPDDGSRRDRWLRRRGGGRAARPGVDGSLDEALSELATMSGQVGMEVADIAGNIDALSAVVQQQAGFSARLREMTEQIAAGNHQVEASVGEAHSATRVAHDEADGSRETVQASLTDLAEFVEWVGGIGGHFARVASALTAITQATGQIGRIAQQTHILALNARIEAARSGAAGHGFQIIADSVRDLADETINAARDIDSTVTPLSVQIGELTEQGEQARLRAETVREGTQSIWAMIETVTGALGSVDHQVAEIQQVAASISAQVDGFLEPLSALADGLEHSSAELGGARERTMTMLDLTEQLVAASARTGARTSDTALIEAAIDAAGRVSALFTAAVDSGEISMADLFDENYRPIPGSNPQQYLARHSAFTDRVLPPIQEPFNELDSRIAFGICTDRNGYIATHMKKVSKPQGSDPLWNAANCRNRRIFNDRTGLTCGRNTEPFVLQTYRRDMGGGKFVMMKDVSAPIWVHGRHWGGFRIGYTA